MKRFVKLFFTLILISSITISSVNLVTPVLAKETSDDTESSKTTETPETTEAPEIIEAPENETPAESIGDEWDGIINDPAPINAPTKESETSTSASPVVITSVVTTVTPPKTVAAPKPATTTVTVPTEPETPAPEEKVTESTSPEDSPKDTSGAAPEATPEIPTTSNPTTDVTKKINLLALISTTIVYFLCIEIWSLVKLAKLRKIVDEAKRPTKSSQPSQQS